MAPSRGTVSMSKLGQLGRFGNQVCQYFFLRTYAEAHGLSFETPAWAGNYLYGFSDAPIAAALPTARAERDFDSEAVFRSCAAPGNGPPPLVDRDIEGFFNFHPRVFKPLECRFRELFTPTAEVRGVLDPRIEEIRAKGRTLVALHLRRGDFGYGGFWIAPASWYLAWLEDLWPTLDRPVLFIASDGLDETLPHFARYDPVCFRRSGLKGEHYFADFHALTQADVVATSNSTFSVVASMLNDRARIFARPHPERRRLIPFDPWLTECLTPADASAVATDRPTP